MKGMPWHRREDNIKIDLEEIVLGYIYCIYLVHDRRIGKSGRFLQGR
jgi:hypothetical protein